MSEIVAYNPAQSAVVNTLAAIARAVENPAVDVGKMQALLSMQRELARDEAQALYNAAFLAMEVDLPIIKKNGAITNKAGAVQSKYAKWEDLNRVVKPILRTHGFVLSFKIGTGDGMTTVEALLLHVGGHVGTSGAMRLPADTSGSKNATQGAGSAVSYGKRYTATAILNIETEGEDNDGQTLGQRQDEVSALEDDGRQVARRGLAAYQEWFQKARTRDERQLLDETGAHERLKTFAREADQRAKDSTFPGDR